MAPRPTDDSQPRSERPYMRIRQAAGPAASGPAATGASAS